ncbi:hypothetical protein RN001_001558 [Aquatica leii]|uniref:Uncharacterized protein n=1 Tax=Aquatica leii TaxID=1421715 RepID=A0AAN7SJM6_9COLE|nr:hypothetical protein RN001_001558 [Aquatica leii]
MNVFVIVYNRLSDNVYISFALRIEMVFLFVCSLRMNNRKVVHSQGRQIVYNVYQCMKKKKEEGLTIPLSQLRERVAEATGVSLSTVKRIIKEGKCTPETS